LDQNATVAAELAKSAGVRLFEWGACPNPDEYADETLNRCARKIGQGEEIRDVGTYAIGVARMLLREMSRDRAKEARSLEDAPELRHYRTRSMTNPSGVWNAFAGAWRS
jgi:hypothetical protein